jgi:hypothetical protein
VRVDGRWHQGWLDPDYWRKTPAGAGRESFVRWSKGLADNYLGPEPVKPPCIPLEFCLSRSRCVKTLSPARPRWGRHATTAIRALRAISTTRATSHHMRLLGCEISTVAPIGGCEYVEPETDQAGPAMPRISR